MPPSERQRRWRTRKGGHPHHADGARANRALWCVAGQPPLAPHRAHGAANAAEQNPCSKAARDPARHGAAHHAEHTEHSAARTYSAYTMIELFGDATGNSTRAAIALAESGLAHGPRKVTLARGEHRAAEYLQLNPTGRVPTLVDSDGPEGGRFVLTQSNAIMLYIAEKSGTLLPSSGVERARAHEWLFFFVTDVIAPSLQAFALGRDAATAHGDAVHRLNERAVALYEHVDRRLADRPFLVGSSFTLADIAGFTITTALEAQLPWDALPHVRRWLDRVGARPAVVRGLSMFR